MTDETYIPDLSSFQGRFADARRTEGFSSTGALAARLPRIPESTLRRWESGETKKPRKATIAPAAAVLRHRVEWLLTGKGNRYVDGAEPPAQPPQMAADKDRPMTVEECEAHFDQAIDSLEHAARTLKFARSQLRKR